MPLGMEVGLGQGDLVLDGDLAPLPKKGGEPPFSAQFNCAQTAGYTKMPLGIKVGLGPDHIMLDGDPAPPPKKRGAQPANVWPMSIVAKWLYGSRCHLLRR